MSVFDHFMGLALKGLNLSHEVMTDFFVYRQICTFKSVTSNSKYTCYSSLLFPQTSRRPTTYNHPLILLGESSLEILKQIQQIPNGQIFLQGIRKGRSSDYFFSSFILTTYSTVCSCHVTYAFQSESRLYSCLNVKELLARSRREV